METTTTFTYGKCNYPVRLFVGIMLFMASFTSYILRVNMSINILGMVHSTHHHNSSSGMPMVEHDFGPRYNWTSSEQSILLGSYFWGYLITQIPGGVLSEWFGGRHVIGVALGLSGVATCLVPISAKLSFWAVFAVRLLTGALGGFIYPAMQNVITKWAPLEEKGKFVFTLIGGTLGTVVTWPVAGFLMQHLGWAWAFYLPALFTLAITFVWYYCVYNAPAQHPAISAAEREYIERSLGTSVAAGKKKTTPPLASLLLSMPFWALLFLHYGSLWAFYFLITAAPKFMNEVLEFNLANSGFLASLPYLVRFVSSFVFAAIGDAIRKRNWLSVTATRKLFTVFSHIIPGLLLLAFGYVGHNATLCVVLITLSMGFNGASTITNLQNAQDLAPNFAATIFSIINFAATTAGFLSPMLVAYYTKENNTIKQWNTIFIINAILYIVPAIIFILFGSGQIQKWNNLTHSDGADVSEQCELHNGEAMPKNKYRKHSEQSVNFVSKL